jgi:hypothetical protein
MVAAMLVTSAAVFILLVMVVAMRPCEIQKRLSISENRVS